MSAFSSTPRVNGALIGNYKGKTVRLVAKVVKLNGDTAIVEASDKGQVELHLNRDAHLSDPYVEVIGKVQDDLSLRVLTTMDLGQTLDMDVVDSVVKLIDSQKDSADSIF